MDLGGIPLFSALQNKLGYLNEREKLIAQNVANASTPGFTPMDLKPFNQQPGMDPKAGAAVLAQPARTDSGLSLGSAKARRQDQPKTYVAVESPDSEATLDGNQVVLEEQMLKMNQARSDYDAAIGFYQKSLSLLQMALRRPGGGA